MLIATACRPETVTALIAIVATQKTLCPAPPMPWGAEGAERLSLSGWGPNDSGDRATQETE